MCLAASFPLLEVVASRVEEKFYDAKQKKWEEFVEDAKSFLDNYHELAGIINSIKTGELGQVNNAFNYLETKIAEFVKEYDNDRNESIDIFELKEPTNRNKLGMDLSQEKPEGGGSQLGDIVVAMKNLEEEVINYRQGRRDKKTTNQSTKSIHPYFLINIENSNSEIGESNSQIESVSDNNSSAPIFNNQGNGKGKKNLSSGSIKNLTKWGKNKKEVNESHELQDWEQQAQTNSNNSSSKYNEKIEIPPKKI